MRGESDPSFYSPVVSRILQAWIVLVQLNQFHARVATLRNEHHYGMHLSTISRQFSHIAFSYSILCTV